MLLCSPLLSPPLHLGSLRVMYCCHAAALNPTRSDTVVVVVVAVGQTKRKLKLELDSFLAN